MRDLAAEVLHVTAPDRYPLMCRWVWDAKVKTGVLREIWLPRGQAEPILDALVMAGGFGRRLGERTRKKGGCEPRRHGRSIGILGHTLAAAASQSGEPPLGEARRPAALSPCPYHRSLSPPTP